MQQQKISCYCQAYLKPEYVNYLLSKHVYMHLIKCNSPDKPNVIIDMSILILYTIIENPLKLLIQTQNFKHY
jgi:hypothetical protein